MALVQIFGHCPPSKSPLAVIGLLPLLVSLAHGERLASQVLRMSLSNIAPVVLGWGPRGLTRQCAHADSTRPVWFQTWCFGVGLNTERMLPSCRLHVCQAPHQDNNASCPSRSHPEATQLTLFLHDPGPPMLPPLHQRPGDCVQQVSLCTNFIRGHLGF